ncbi:MAG TPA: hypothetical protein VGL83_07160, partial [Stellaceae bacterium]
MNWSPDWIIALAGIGTTIATALTAYFMWRQQRRDDSESAPIVEMHLSAVRQPARIMLRFVVRNRLNENCNIEWVSLRHPRRGEISRKKAPTAVGAQPYGGGQSPGFERSGARHVVVNLTVAPIGTIDDSPLAARMMVGTLRSDVTEFDVAFFPPSGWRGGQLVVDLAITET